MTPEASAKNKTDRARERERENEGEGKIFIIKYIFIARSCAQKGFNREQNWKKRGRRTDFTLL